MATGYTYMTRCCWSRGISSLCESRITSVTDTSQELSRLLAAAWLHPQCSRDKDVHTMLVRRDFSSFPAQLQYEMSTHASVCPRILGILFRMDARLSQHSNTRARMPKSRVQGANASQLSGVIVDQFPPARQALAAALQLARVERLLHLVI